MDGIEPTVQEISDRFVRQFELAAADRHRDRAMRAADQFKTDLDFWFFSNATLPDDEPIGYLLPVSCVKYVCSSGILTVGDFRTLTRDDLMQVANLSKVNVDKICSALARFGVGPRKKVS